MTVSKIKVDIVLANRKQTAKAFCEEVGISRNRFYTIMNSKNVAPRTVGRLAEALNVAVTDILEE